MVKCLFCHRRRHRHRSFHRYIYRCHHCHCHHTPLVKLILSSLSSLSSSHLTSTSLSILPSMEPSVSHPVTHRLSPPMAHPVSHRWSLPVANPISHQWSLPVAHPVSHQLKPPVFLWWSPPVSHQSPINGTFQWLPVAHRWNLPAFLWWNPPVAHPVFRWWNLPASFLQWNPPVQEKERMRARMNFHLWFFMLIFTQLSWHSVWHKSFGHWDLATELSKQTQACCTSKLMELDCASTGWREKQLKHDVEEMELIEWNFINWPILWMCVHFAPVWVHLGTPPSLQKFIAWFCTFSSCDALFALPRTSQDDIEWDCNSFFVTFSIHNFWFCGMSDDVFGINRKNERKWNEVCHTVQWIFVIATSFEMKRAQALLSKMKELLNDLTQHHTGLGLACEWQDLVWCAQIMSSQHLSSCSSTWQKLSPCHSHHWLPFAKTTHWHSSSSIFHFGHILTNPCWC